MISTRHVAPMGRLVPSVRALQNTRSLATVTDDPLSDKVEMSNWEKGNYINYKKMSENLSVVKGRLRVRAVAFSPDGKRIASGSYDKIIKVRDAATGDLEKTLADHSHSIKAMTFSPDNK